MEETCCGQGDRLEAYPTSRLRAPRDVPDWPGSAPARCAFVIFAAFCEKLRSQAPDIPAGA